MTNLITMRRPLSMEIPFRDPFDVYSMLRAPGSIFFESQKGTDNIGRYSFICIEPYLSFRIKNGNVEVTYQGKKTVSHRKPLHRLRELLKAYQQEHDPDLPPFQGGAAGMFCYDFVRYFEKLPSTAVDDLDMPDAHFFMYDRVISFDHKHKRSWIIICPGARDTALGFSDIARDNNELEAEASAELGRIGEMIANAGDVIRPADKSNVSLNIVDQTAKEQYMLMVRKAKEYIAAGDIFQANLSLRITAKIGGIDPFRIYETLREINPSPFAAYMDTGNYQIVSSSPERLARVAGNRVDTRPIAGTRPRGSNIVEDNKMRAELLLNEKERAEHIMLIDLERNDLGKISDYGTVSVDELMTTEQYSHVIHIVSNVQGRLADGKDCFDAIKAVFPGGTITGVPKVRCMEIIEELEGKRRGPYTGSLGYIGFNGNMDLNIIIRTFCIKNGHAYVQAGAGIVADSVAEREYYESLKKAEALLKTLDRIRYD